ncbi:MAG: hypothetical protein M1839_008315 [Geoglossum umbratile]|nr:MAG: hypothetical protein M1839_008315 [Geoglossum umbratile]
MEVVPNRLRVNDVYWLFHIRDQTLINTDQATQLHSETGYLEWVPYGKVAAEYSDGVLPLLVSINEIRRMEGKAVWTQKDIIDAAEGHPVLSEEQLVRVLEKLGAYRLAVIEPTHRFRPKPGVGSGEEGAIVYICFNRNGHWEGVQLTSPYSRYLIPELANDNAAVAAAHPDDRESLRAGLLSRLKGYAALEVYSDYQRNPPYLEIPITRVRTWGGATAREGGAGEGLRLDCRPMRAGRRRRVLGPK